MATARSAAAKRLMKEYRDLQDEPSPEFVAFPLENDLFHWHFTVRGPPSNGFKGGRYHGRIIFPTDYPFKPPNIIFLTPNGRFETNKKICLSITGYHPESWRPAWGVRTALVAIISFFTAPGEGSVGAIEWSEEERAKAAVASLDFVCDVCGCQNRTCLPSEQDVPSQVLQVDPELSLTEPMSRETSTSEAPNAPENLDSQVNETVTPTAEPSDPLIQLSEEPTPTTQSVLSTETTVNATDSSVSPLAAHVFVPENPQQIAQRRTYELVGYIDRLIISIVVLLFASLWIK